MKPHTYTACGACGHRRGVAAAECPRYDCPWLQRPKYREYVARQLGARADKLFAQYLDVKMDTLEGMQLEN